MYNTDEILNKMAKYFLSFTYIKRNDIIFAEKFSSDSYNVTFIDSNNNIRSAIYYLEKEYNFELFPRCVVNRNENIVVYNNIDRVNLFYLFDYTSDYKIGFYLMGDHIHRLDIQNGGEWKIDYTNDNLELIDGI